MFAVASNGNRLVTGGIGGIYYSDDGATWTAAANNPFSVFLIDIVWLPDRKQWIAVGEGTNSIAYSDDGVTWIGKYTNLPYITGVVLGYSISGAGYINANGTNNSIVLAKYGSLNTNVLDVVAEGYYNSGFSNMTVSVKSKNNQTQANL